MISRVKSINKEASVLKCLWIFRNIIKLDLLSPVSHLLF